MGQLGISASTGPRSGERGRTATQPFASALVMRLQRGRALESAEGFISSMRLRIALALQRGRALESAEGQVLEVEKKTWEMLQRGRALESAEGVLIAIADDFSAPASTGPRSGERGRFRQGGGPYALRRWLQRGRARESAEGEGGTKDPTALDQASTGPRSGERGRRCIMPTNSLK